MYLPPEMCEQRPYDTSCDMWGLGCILYELAARTPPVSSYSSIIIRLLPFNKSSGDLDIVYNNIFV